MISSTISLILLYGLSSALYQVELLKNTLINKKIICQGDIDEVEFLDLDQDLSNKNNKQINGEKITYCNNCGNQIFSDEKKCSFCGKKIIK